MALSTVRRFFLVFTLVMLVATAVWAEPEEYEVFALPSSISGATGGKLIVPKGEGPYPLAIASHGWASSANYMAGWGKMLAEIGFVVVVPSFPNPLMPNQKINTNITVDLVDYYREPPCGSPAHGKVDSTRLAMVSHSAGSVSTALAALELDPQVIVFFDPVDTKSDIPPMYEDFCAPHLAVFANPSSCNEDSEWKRQNLESEGPAVTFRVKGSTHCDGEKPSRTECGPFCAGAASANRQAEYERYALAMVRAWLWDDAASWQDLSFDALSANDMLLDVSVRDGEACHRVSPDEEPHVVFDDECGGSTDEPIDTDDPTDVTTDDPATDPATDPSTDPEPDTEIGTDDTDTPADTDVDQVKDDIVADDLIDSADDSCACRLAGGQTGGSGLFLLTLAFVFVWMRRVLS